MSREQNIDDILKMLKESVSDNEFNTVAPPREEQGSAEACSDEDLQRRLKEAYTQERSDSNEEWQTPYDLDYEFLDRIRQEEEQEIVCEEVPLVEEAVDPQEAQAEIEEIAGTPDTEAACDEAEPVCASELTADTVDSAGEEVGSSTASASASTVAVLVRSQTAETMEEQSDESDVERKDDREPPLCETEKEEETEQPCAALENEPPATPFAEDQQEAERVDEAEPIMEERSPTASESWIDYETESEEQSEPLMPEIAMADLPDPPISEARSEPLHASVVDLMIQLGCEEEWEQIENGRVSDDFLPGGGEEASLGAEEYRQYSQTEEFYHTYQLKKRRSFWRLLGVAILTGIIFLYDTLPLFGVRFSGIMDYSVYPGSYVLIGFQLLLICSLFLGKDLFGGLKKVFSLRPNLYSAVVLLFLCVFAYDMILVLNSVWPCTMLHFLCAWLFLTVVIGEHLLLLRELKVFSVYSTEAGKNQYTLQKSEGTSSFAEQMYASGLDRGCSVYVPKSVDFPTGFFSSVKEDMIRNRVLSFSLLPIFLISVFFLLISVLLNNDIEYSALIAMTVLFSAVPIGTACAIAVPMYGSAKRLQSRGIGITGTDSIEEYAKCNTVIYTDLHLFRKCNSKDIGIAIYETAQSQAIFGSLALLYETIGGPMSEVFADIPKQCRFQKIRIHRIFKNGIEAFVDRKHLLIVGDAAFMQRYGLTFPENETDRGNRKALCVSLDGKCSAKFSVQYQTTPLFEMLVERLAQEHVQVVIETFDPMIQAELVASSRTIGSAPISVLHKNVSHLYRRAMPDSGDRETGILATASRLKLIEAVIWCKRLFAVRKRNHLFACIWSVCGVGIAALLLGFRNIDVIDQYWLWLLTVLSQVGSVLLSLKQLPSKHYFTEDAYLAEVNKRPQRTKKTKQKTQKESKP